MAIGKLDKDGCLKILRKRFMKNVFCPYSEIETKCGDWCAKFGEPQENVIENKSGQRMKLDNKIILSICTGSWMFETFIDERDDTDTKKGGKNEQNF